MNLFEALEWSNWKNLSIEVKVQVISQVLMYFVSPLKQVADVEYCEFELAGVKCGSFECSIDGEQFVLLPGNREAILGWDLGIQGIPLTAWDKELPNKTAFTEQLIQSYDLKTAEDWDIFVNESTSSLRKATIAPMLVQKQALPAGTSFIGSYDAITGEFTGQVEQFTPIEAAFRKHFKQPSSFEESLSWKLPPELFENNLFYAAMQPTEETYLVYRHTSCTLRSLRKKLHQEVFDLLDEDQWEYAVGAGTRKLFRWGVELDMNQPYYGKQAAHKMMKENMFGLLFDTTRNRWEITDDNRLKLEKMPLSEHPLFDMLPLSSYYRSRKLVSEEDILDPCAYFYRKAIIIRSE